MVEIEDGIETESIQEQILEQELEQEILEVLKILEIEDRDIKSITIWCNLNPKSTHVPDKSIKKRILPILEKLMKSGKIKHHKSPKNREVYSLIS